MTRTRTKAELTKMVADAISTLPDSYKDYKKDLQKRALEVIENGTDMARDALSVEINQRVTKSRLTEWVSLFIHFIKVLQHG